jgi:hypothetical protein
MFQKETVTMKRAIERKKPLPRQRAEEIISYIERYRIGETLFGIEDYMAPGKHFMPTEPHRRFRVWNNGCGIGQFDTLKASRQFLFDYILKDIIRVSDYAIKIFTEQAVILDRLSNRDGVPELSRMTKFAIITK